MFFCFHILNCLESNLLAQIEVNRSDENWSSTQFLILLLIDFDCDLRLLLQMPLFISVISRNYSKLCENGNNWSNDGKHRNKTANRLNIRNENPFAIVFRYFLCRHHKTYHHCITFCFKSTFWSIRLAKQMCHEHLFTLTKALSIEQWKTVLDETPINFSQ